MSNQTYIDNYITIINSSRNIILNIINLLESEHYNESNNLIVNNIINLLNEQDSRIIQCINYNREQERELERLRLRRHQNNILNETPNNLIRQNRLRRQRLSRNIESQNNDIINILLPVNNGNNGNNSHNFLSPSQIIISTKIMKYSELDENIKTNQTRCPISYHDFTDETEIILIKHCKHIFKKQSLLNWFLQSKICPMCRYDLSTYTDEDISGSNSQNNIYSPTNRNSSNTTTTSPDISIFSHLIYYGDIENQI